MRAARILLGERDVSSVGLIGRRPRTEDHRLGRAVDLAEYDVLVSDDIQDPAVAVRMALEAGIGCVLFADGADLDVEYGPEFAENGRSLLLGANLAGGIAPALASHETARGGEILEIAVAWTEPGTPLRRGAAMPFPDPVGARWARRVEVDDLGYAAYAAPIRGEWAAAVARVTSASGGGVVTRVVGVADLAAHLEGLALAAGAIALDVYASGAHRPAWAAEVFLAAALGAGLDVAAYTVPAP